MASWHLAISEMPGRPFAVVNGRGDVAGCFATRAAAVIQMTQLNIDDADTFEDTPAEVKSDKKETETPTVGKPWTPPPIAYTTPTTQTW